MEQTHSLTPLSTSSLSHNSHSHFCDSQAISDESYKNLSQQNLAASLALSSISSLMKNREHLKYAKDFCMITDKDMDQDVFKLPISTLNMIGLFICADSSMGADTYVERVIKSPKHIDLMKKLYTKFKENKVNCLEEEINSYIISIFGSIANEIATHLYNNDFIYNSSYEANLLFLSMFNKVLNGNVEDVYQLCKELVEASKRTAEEVDVNEKIKNALQICAYPEIVKICESRYIYSEYMQKLAKHLIDSGIIKYAPGNQLDCQKDDFIKKLNDEQKAIFMQYIKIQIAYQHYRQHNYKEIFGVHLGNFSDEDKESVRIIQNTLNIFEQGQYLRESPQERVQLFVRELLRKQLHINV